MKELACIKEFDGNRRNLTPFITVVGTHLEVVNVERKVGLWQIIYNANILGNTNKPATWKTAQEFLKLHSSPGINHREICKRITNLKVSWIFYFNRKTQYVQTNQYFYFYEINPNQTSTLLVNKIKLSKFLRELIYRN